MKPWVPRPVTSAFQADVDAFVQAACEVHVMGRVNAKSIFDEFALWKREQDDTYFPTLKERERFMSHMKSAFVYHTGVPVTRDATGAPGFYGMYLKTATQECREVGYNRSPNTHAAVLKLDALGNVVDTIESQDAFAHGVAKRSPQHICKELTKCFRNGMKGFMPGDGYAYMRAADHVALLAAQAAQASQAAQAAQGAQGA